jgi:hypothetical protein
LFSQIAGDDPFLRPKIVFGDHKAPPLKTEAAPYTFTKPEEAMQTEQNKPENDDGPPKKAPGYDDTVERDSGSDPAIDDPDPGRSPVDDPDTEGPTDDDEDENGEDPSNFSIGG